VFCFADADHAGKFQARFGGFMVEPNAKARRVVVEWLRAAQAVASTCPRQGAGVLYRGLGRVSGDEG
jgi:hypothetical protein